MPEELKALNERYKLLSRAGSGGMATVYKAQDLLLGRLVAVKVLHPALTHDEAFLRRFQREARAAANLSHPNVVTVHDIGHDSALGGDQFYIVMEYVKGRTLKQLIRDEMALQGRPLPIARSLDLMISTCAGIGYAHRAHLVHCDVKPQNVLVTPGDQVKVTDFGIARAMSQTSIYEASMLWGTPHYFSPEQAGGQIPTPASDVYALGVILFEMLTGRLPFEAESLPGLALKHMNELPPPVTEFNPAVPPQLERIIQKVLDKEPTGRYRTADQLESILRSYRDSSAEATGPIIVPVAAVASQIASEAEAPSSATSSEQAPGSHTATRRAPDISERQTMVMNRQPGPERDTWPGPASTPEPIPMEAESEEAAELSTILLGLLAIVLLLGLIPLWYLVFLAWTN